jgi:hypothetical protein
LNNEKGSVDEKLRYSAESTMVAANYFSVEFENICKPPNPVVKLIVKPLPSLNNTLAKCDDISCDLDLEFEEVVEVNGITQSNVGEIERIVEFKTDVESSVFDNFYPHLVPKSQISHTATFRRYDDGWRIVSSN